MTTAPVANDDQLTFQEQSTTLRIEYADLLANDEYSGNGTLTINGIRGDLGPTERNANVPGAGVASLQDTYIEFQWLEGQRDYYGTFELLYTVTDGILEDEGIVRVTIENVNDVPFGNPDGYKVEQGTTLTLEGDRGVLRNDIVDARNVDGDELVSILDQGPSNGTVNLNEDGSFTYTPNAGFSGVDSFTYFVNDGTVNSDMPITVNLDVVAAAPADAPVANDDTFSGQEDPTNGAIVIKTADVLSNDVYNGGPNPIQLDSVFGAIGGQVNLEDANIIFIPDANFNGEASFIYVLSDERLTDYGKVTINIAPVNDAPLPNAEPEPFLDRYMAYTGQKMFVNRAEGVLFNDFDFDGDDLTVQLSSGPSNGTLNLFSKGAFNYTSNNGFSGQDEFFYTVSDGQVTSDPVRVVINVNGQGTEGGNGKPLPPMEDGTSGGWEGSNGPTAGDDTFNGGSKNDNENGQNGNDSLNGKDGDDTLFGGELSDTLDGGAGDDRLWGNKGKDDISGGNGADILGGGGFNDTLNGGGGMDTLYGGVGADMAMGGTGDDELDGGDGNDQLNGDSGNDLIMGGNGTDAAFGGEGQDNVSGDGGNDTVAGNNGDDTVGGGDGDDLVFGGGGLDLLFGGTGNDEMYGGTENDEVYGLNGRDTINGGAGDDTVNGNGANDVVNGDGGADVVLGGLGNDKVRGDDGNDLVDGEAGNDTVRGGNGDDTMFGGAGMDTLYGGQGNDRAWGGDDNDEVFGLDGNDTLGGGAGDDSLFGGTGDDELFGLAGADLLYGATGNDTMEGGIGADVFIFEVGEGVDVITDFDITEDTLRLNEAIWGGGRTAQEVVDDFGSASGGNTVLQFSANEIITLNGIGTPDDIVSQIDIV